MRKYLNIRSNRVSSRGLVPVEGLWMIRAALASGGSFEAVFVCPDLLRGDESVRLVEQIAVDGTAVLGVSERVMGRMVSRDGPDGLAGLARLPSFRLCDLRPGRFDVVLILDGLELPGNVGSLIRCADAVSAGAVVVTNRRVRLDHPLLLKASMGTVFSVPVVASDAEEAFRWCRQHDFRLVAADPGRGTSYREATYTNWVAIVVGSERYGLSAVWRAWADERVAIPMLGRADSLNVGHAGALLLYEALHHHMTSAGSPTPRQPHPRPARPEPDTTERSDHD